MTTVLEAQQLTGGYKRTPVVHDLDITVGAGQVTAMIGPNGAGKTTTLLTLAGELPALSGTVLLGGKATSKPLHRRAGGGLSLVCDDRAVFMTLSVLDNLKVGGVTPESVLDTFPELTPRLKTKVGNLSGGEQQMLGIGRALARRPKVLLIDEMSLGLAPLVVSRLMEAVRAAADAGVGILFVAQHLREALVVADHVYVLRKGRIELSGPAAEVAQQADTVAESFLGA